MNKKKAARVLGNSDMLTLLTHLSGKMQLEFTLYDADGRRLWGQAPLDASDHRWPLSWEGETIGWLLSRDARVSGLIEVIDYVLRTEAEKKILATETLEKYKEISLLYEISERIAASLDIEEVAHLIIEKVRKLIEGDQGSVMLLNESTDEYEVVAGFGSQKSPKTVLRSSEGIVGAVLRSGIGEIVNNVERDPRYVKGHIRITSMLCVPLKIKDRVIGVINISSQEYHQYSSDHLKLLTTIASEVAVAIDNARLYTRLKNSFISTVYTLADTIEKRDPYTGGHTRRVMEYSLAIGEGLGLSKKELTNLQLTAILHDIGKIGVPDGILLKNGKLTEEEFAQMKLHPIFGVEILKHIGELNDLGPGIKYHHERYDGKGYPEGLKGEDIPIVARIIAVADTFDAMTSDRPYRRALSLEEAFNELRRNSGTQFDPGIIRCFIHAYEEEKLSHILQEPRNHKLSLPTGGFGWERKF